MTAPSSLGKGLNVKGIANRILQAVEEHFAAANVDLPDRRYVAPGAMANTAWEFADPADNVIVCGQVVVTLEGIGWGASSIVTGDYPKPGSHVSAVGIRHAVFAVQIARCTPSSDRNDRRTITPPAADIQEAGESFMIDAGLLSQALLTMTSELRNSFLPDRTGIVQPGLVQPVGPDGGMHAVQGGIEITVGELA